MKNIISFITLTLCIMVSAVNAQNTTAANTSTSIVLSHNVAAVIEDIDTEDVAVRNMAMLLEEVSPETAPVVSVSLNQGFTKVVASVIEDVDTEDVAVRNMAMSQEEVSPEATEVNIARNYVPGEKVTAKY